MQTVLFKNLKGVKMLKFIAIILLGACFCCVDAEGGCWAKRFALQRHGTAIYPSMLRYICKSVSNIFLSKKFNLAELKFPFYYF